MLESRENFEGIKSRTEEISTDELETIVVMALIEISEALTKISDCLAEARQEIIQAKQEGR